MKNYLIGISLVLIFGVGVYFLVVMTSPKIGYVRSSELVNKYAGMQEASVIYKKKMAQWQSNIDTLESDYQRSVGKYNLEFSKSSTAVRKEQEALLEKQRQNIQQYVKTLEDKARDEDQKMTDGVIHQINSFVEEYGKSHHYDFILGTTQQGNILYGAKAKDITEEVLEALNENYKKGEIKK